MHLKSVDEDGYCRLCSYKESGEDILKEEALNWMLAALDTDAETYLTEGMFDFYKLGKAACSYLDKDEWENDLEHWIWKMALELEAYGRSNAN